MTMNTLTIKRVRRILQNYVENPVPLTPSGYEALRILMDMHIVYNTYYHQLGGEVNEQDEEEEDDEEEKPEEEEEGEQPQQQLPRRRSISCPPDIAGRSNSTNDSHGHIRNQRTNANTSSPTTPRRRLTVFQRAFYSFDNDENYDPAPVDITWAPPRPPRSGVLRVDWDRSHRNRPRRLFVAPPLLQPPEEPVPLENQLTQTTPTRPGRPHNFRFIDDENSPAPPRGVKRPNEDPLSTPKRRRDFEDDH